MLGISSIVPILILPFTVTGIETILLEPFLKVIFTFASKLPTTSLVTDSTTSNFLLVSLGCYLLK